MKINIGCAANMPLMDELPPTQKSWEGSYHELIEFMAIPASLAWYTNELWTR